MWLKGGKGNNHLIFIGGGWGRTSEREPENFIFPIFGADKNFLRLLGPNNFLKDTGAHIFIKTLGGDPCMNGLLQLSWRNYHKDIAWLVGCFEDLSHFGPIEVR